MPVDKGTVLLSTLLFFNNQVFPVVQPQPEYRPALPAGQRTHPAAPGNHRILNRRNECHAGHRHQIAFNDFLTAAFRASGSSDPVFVLPGIIGFPKPFTHPVPLLPYARMFRSLFMDIVPDFSKGIQDHIGQIKAVIFPLPSCYISPSQNFFCKIIDKR